MTRLRAQFNRELTIGYARFRSRRAQRSRPTFDPPKPAADGIVAVTGQHHVYAHLSGLRAVDDICRLQCPMFGEG